MLVNHRKIRKLLTETKHSVGMVTVTARAAELTSLLWLFGRPVDYVLLFMCCRPAAPSATQ